METSESVALFKSVETTMPAHDAPAAKTETTTGEGAASPAAQARDDAGRFKGAGKTDGGTPEVKTGAETTTETTTTAKVPTPAAAIPEEKPQGTMAALLAERSKRQAAERELAALKAGNGSQAAPDIFTDPDKAVSTMVEQRVAPIMRRFFTASLETAQTKYSDFDAAASSFMALLDKNPALENQWRNADDPGEFAYVVGTSTPEFRKVREESHRSEITTKDAEITALKAKVAALEAGQKAQQEVPDSLNRQPSGALPARDSDVDDIRTIVRFKSS